jgi:DNA-binding MarR family transcriptional regulator
MLLLMDQLDSSALDFSSMEFFVLASIQNEGLTSYYALQQRAGLQPGGIRNVMRNLEHAGVVVRADASARRRRDFALTAKGRGHLKQSWKNCLREYPDVEGVLRAAYVATVMGDVHYAGWYLEDQALRRRTTAEEKQMEATRLEESQTGPLSTFMWMRTLIEARRRQVESQTLESLGRLLRERHQPHVSSEP